MNDQAHATSQVTCNAVSWQAKFHTAGCFYDWLTRSEPFEPLAEPCLTIASRNATPRKRRLKARRPGLVGSGPASQSWLLDKAHQGSLSLVAGTDVSRNSVVVALILRGAEPNPEASKLPEATHQRPRSCASRRSRLRAELAVLQAFPPPSSTSSLMHKPLMSEAHTPPNAGRWLPLTTCLLSAAAG